MSGSGAPGAEVRTTSEAGTEAAGRALGAVIRRGDLLALNGALGAGKTCFVRGLAAGMGADAEEVRSPTFVIHQVHTGGRAPLHHLDLYRLPDTADVEFLDLEDLLSAGVVAVEWAGRADLRALNPVGLTIEVTLSEERLIRLDASAPDRLSGAWR